MGVGFPHQLHLNRFGEILLEVFGEMPYQVGSSVEKKDGWRDVDVRIMLSPEDWKAWGLAPYELDKEYLASNDARREGLCMAFSALGERMTHLPIDFQLQPADWANHHYGGKGHPRSACAIVPSRFVDYKHRTLVETVTGVDRPE